MHDQLCIVAGAALAPVCGGGTSTGATSFSVRAAPPSGAPIELRGSAGLSRSDRDTCVLAVQQMGGTAGDAVAVCGPPPRS